MCYHLYRPTLKGGKFVRNKITVPSHVILLRNEVIGWSETHINIEEALGEHFNYYELMNGD